MNLYYRYPGNVLKYGNTDQLVYVLINIYNIRPDSGGYAIHECWGSTGHEWYSKKLDMEVIY